MMLQSRFFDNHETSTSYRCPGTVAVEVASTMVRDNDVILFKLEGFESGSRQGFRVVAHHNMPVLGYFCVPVNVSL